MYNGQSINVLLKEKKLRAKDLLAKLNIRSNGSISSLVNGNPSAARLEEIADFFEVPIDALFKREKQYESSVLIAEMREKLQQQDRIIEEKDKRIALLEDMVIMLKGNTVGRKSIDIK